MAARTQDADARVAVLRADPRVVVRRRTASTPYVPQIEVSPDVDVLELLGRRDPPAEVPERPA
jgi:hypothetical protein